MNRSSGFSLLVAFAIVTSLAACNSSDRDAAPPAEREAGEVGAGPDRAPNPSPAGASDWDDFEWDDSVREDDHGDEDDRGDEDGHGDEDDPEHVHPPHDPRGGPDPCLVLPAEEVQRTLGRSDGPALRATKAVVADPNVGAPWPMCSYVSGERTVLSFTTYQGRDPIELLGRARSQLPHGTTMTGLGYDSWTAPLGSGDRYLVSDFGVRALGLVGSLDLDQMARLIEEAHANLAPAGD
jgi:hypothetical protein